MSGKGMTLVATSRQVFVFPATGTRVAAGLGAFAQRAFRPGDQVCPLQGRPSWTPPGDDVIEQAYVLQTPRSPAPYLDQRGLSTPDVLVHTTTRRADANVVLDLDRHCYTAVRAVAPGEELLMLGTRLGAGALLYHQACLLTPAGSMSTPFLKVKRSHVAGLGCFAREAVPAGRLLGAYLGARVSLDNARAVPGPYEFYMDQGRRSYIVDGQEVHQASILRFVNHTEDAALLNTSFERVDGCGIVAVTTRPVARHQELLAHYGEHAAGVVASDTQRAAMLAEAEEADRKRKQEDSDRDLAFLLGGVRRTRARR